ncbi:MAG: hypothetical protein KDD33_03680 [Bdellovibrionales bacterium]|nr:hypothetical protein [Bdellovibrionales bacterium]
MLQLFLTLFLFVHTSSAEPFAKIWCDDKFSDEIREIDNVLVPKVDSCVNDVVWGSPNTCFEGNRQKLVDRINGGDYEWKKSFLWMEKGELGDADDEVFYTGVDQQSFWANSSDIYHCTQEFLDRIGK